MDSAGYIAENIKECGNDIKWVSRIPETLVACKELIEANHENWQKLDDEHDYISFGSTYAGQPQQWLLVFSKQAFGREIKTLKKTFAKGSEQELKAFQSLCREEFDCKKDADKAANSMIKSFKYLTINNLKTNQKPVYECKGRPKKEETPKAYKFQISGEACCEVERLKKMAQNKGRFVIATNELDDQIMPPINILKTYKGQSKAEKGFRFLKDPQFMASTLFVKKPERVEALMFIMALCLTVYAALEYKIRNALKVNDKTFPNQLKKEVKNPTARWVFACFGGIDVLKKGLETPIILNLKTMQLDLLNLLGESFRKYYIRV
jgi:transposase